MRGPDWPLRRAMKGVMGWAALVLALAPSAMAILLFADVGDAYGNFMLWILSMAWIFLPALAASIAAISIPPLIQQAPGVTAAAVALGLLLANLGVYAWLLSVQAFRYMT